MVSFINFLFLTNHTLPVVVHIIHQNGSENISDAQVIQGIQYLNEAFANTGWYNPDLGVNTDLQFCLAQRDPENNPTNGITRTESPLIVFEMNALIIIQNISLVNTPIMELTDDSTDAIEILYGVFPENIDSHKFIHGVFRNLSRKRTADRAYYEQADKER